MESVFTKKKIDWMKYIERVSLVMVNSVSIVNLTAGIIGGVWLLFNGLFIEVGAGFLYAMFGHYIWGFVIMVGLIFGAPGAKLLEKGKNTFGFIFLLLSQLVSIVIVFFSVLYVFWVAAPLLEYASLIPVLLFAYAVSFAPWAFLADHDRRVGNTNAAVMIVNGQFGFIIGVLLMLITGQGFLVSIFFLIGLISGTILNIIPVVEEIKRKKGEEEQKKEKKKKESRESK